MKHGYAASKYYGILEKLINLGLSQRLIAKMALDALEEELAHPEIYGDWLTNHYNSTAEYLAYDCDLHEEEHVYEMIETARREIEIFAKYGYEQIAAEMHEMLEPVIREMEV